METKLINIYGGPGTGKSSVAAGVFTLLKLHRINCELAAEYAKELLWGQNLGILNYQWKVFGEQSYRLTRLNGQVEIILTDSPLIQSINYIGDQYKEQYKNVILETEKEFSEVNHIFLERVVPYDEVGREQTEEESNKIANKTLEYLQTFANNLIVLPGNYISINTIANLILMKMGINPNYKIQII